MKYGYFDDKAKEYVITTYNTPSPWINYLGNKNFFGLISNTAGGYCFYKDAKLRRILRYRYNNIPQDSNGRYYYIKDNGTTFNPGFMPTCTPLDDYKCRHGLNYSIFEASKNNLQTSLLTFVPQDDNLEIHQLTLTNNSNINKTIDVYSMVEWCLYNAVDDANNFQRNLNIAEVEVENNTIFHKTEYRERRNHYTYFYCSEDIKGFDTDRDQFVGKYHSFKDPEVVNNNQSLNSMVSGNSPIGSHHLEFELKPNESKTVIFLLGYIENDAENKYIAPNVINKEKAYQQIAKFNTTIKVAAAFKELKNYWDKLLNRFQIQSDDEKFDRMVNIWHQYQVMITFNLSRSASYYESGTGRGMGFRDSCQDLLGANYLIGKRAYERIIDIASIQFEDGSTYHQYQPLTKRGNSDVGGGFNDDPLWLIACTVSYIKETGDYSILKHMTPFNNEPNSEKPLFDHLKASINYTLNNLGPHKLPLIGRADWNDCLNLNCFSKESGESFQTASNYESKKAESVFIAAMFVKYGKEYAQLCESINLTSEAKRIYQAVSAMEQAVINFGWDGEWFLRAYDAFENKVGSKENQEGQIYIEPQGFATMANIGHSLGLGKKALNSVKKHLVNDYGVELLSPCYTSYHLELGEISSYPPGYKENGSVFCHNNPWIVLAFLQENLNDDAFNIYKLTAPAYTEDNSDIHVSEPYVYSQTIAGRAAKKYGMAKNSWLTGTAAWALVAATQGILGIQPEFNGLRVHPQLPSSIKNCQITRVFRNTTYLITIDNQNRNQQTMYVDGKLVEDDLILFDNQSEVKITIEM